jgi:hypothetical protein
MTEMDRVVGLVQWTVPYLNHASSAFKGGHPIIQQKCNSTALGVAHTPKLFAYGHTTVSTPALYSLVCFFYYIRITLWSI